ncbi:MAG: tetratricopeptide repeat protein [Nonlabens sp.]|uniref:tetratricopeptide repeat protein n=1 Tax=Nonlabens sp. TaxID=1888209 RepID=UPI003EF7F279
MKNRFLFILLLLAIGSQAQNKAVDSVRNELRLHKQKDTTRVRLLNSLIYDLNEYNLDGIDELIKESEYLIDSLNFEDGKAELYYFKGHIALKKSDFQNVIETNQKAYDIYKKLNNKKGISYSLNSIGIAHYSQGNLDKAIEYFENSAVIDRERNDLKGVAAVLNNVGNIYADRGDYDQAVVNYTKSLEIRRQIKDSIDIASSLTNIGGIFGEQNNAPKAIEYLNQALDIHNSLEIPNEYETLTITINLAIIYQMQQQYDKAINYYNKALELSRKYGKKEVIAGSLNGLGFIKLAQDKDDEALPYLLEALEINKEINDQYGIANGLSFIAEIEYSKGNYEKALDYFKQSEKICEEIGNAIGVSRTYFGLAKVYSTQGNNDLAFEYLEKCEEISIQFNFLDAQRDCKDLYYQIYEKSGQYKKALENHVAYKNLNDSIFNKENIEKIAQLENQFKYQKELDSASIRELKLTKTVKDATENLEKSQRNLLLGVIAFLLLTLALAAIIFSLKLRNAKAKTQNIVMEQKLLRSQMTPHFIFNSLSVLQGMILNKDEEKSISYLSKFSKLLRTILENSRHRTVSLADELSAIDSYVELQNLDTDPPFHFKYEIDKNIDPEALKIPPMLIQPFIENAIEHAFPDRSKHKEINVAIRFHGDQLTCTIDDNGVGISKDDQKINKTKKSLATTITSERLKVLSKDFNSPGSLTLKNKMEDGKNGTMVTLIIPYIS